MRSVIILIGFGVAILAVALTAWCAAYADGPWLDRFLMVAPGALMVHVLWRWHRLAERHERCLERTRALHAMLNASFALGSQLHRAGIAVLHADERGQGVLYAEAMAHLAEVTGFKPGGPQ